MPPTELMHPPRVPEAIPEDAGLDDALGATIRNAGLARENAAQLGWLEEFINRAGAVK